MAEGGRAKSRNRQPLVINGGVSAWLQCVCGGALHPTLWSAAHLANHEGRQQILQVHRDFISAGADIITTCSYQASIQGFLAAGLAQSEEQAKAFIASSVDLARTAASDKSRGQESSRRRWWMTDQSPCVVASVGPYGAILADGSEYRGNYGLSVAELVEFHREKVRVLVNAGVRIVAFETVPELEEVIAIVKLMENEFADVAYWISLQCRNESHIASGASVSDVCTNIKELAPGKIIGLGVNCFDPRYACSLVEAIATHGDDAWEILCYPNKGEAWDAARKEWVAGTGSADAFSAQAATWIAAGATIVGGCCRVTPSDIAGIQSE